MFNSIVRLTRIGASPTDGSSITRMRGADISARASASICCSPPERLPASFLMSAEKIRELNDRFRSKMTCGLVMLTAGVDALPSDVKAMVIRRVATFSEFTPDNDPHKEHDFGNFTLAGRKFFFKIEAYDTEMRFGSEDPADP